MRDCRKATQVIDSLLSSLGLTRHMERRELVGGARVKHLGCVMDLNRMRFYMVPRKIAKILVSREISSGNHGKGGGGLRGTGYDRSVMNAFHCR
jgi:hypothetical protein